MSLGWSRSAALFEILKLATHRNTLNMMSFVVAALVPGVAVASDLDLWNSFSDITLWNGASNVKWHQTNDPVMGGKSTGP